MAGRTQKLISAEDVLRFQLIADARLSPDGGRAVYSLQRADEDQNKYFANLWLVDAEGSAPPRPFTQGNQRDGSPRWAPDGRSIAFISDREEGCQVWWIPADGGEACCLTTLEEGSIGGLEWSPDGTRIAFSYRPAPAWQTKKAREEREKSHRSTPPLEIKRLIYRCEGQGSVGEERWHLYVLDLATREVTQLTRGEHDQNEFCWSPDGTRLAFITNRSANPDRDLQLREIRTIPAAGGEEKPVPAPAGPKGALTWSPDGKWLAYYGHTDIRDVWSATDAHLWVIPAEGGEGRDLSAPLDRPSGDATLGDLRAFNGWDGPTWSADGARIYFPVSDRGSVHLYAADPATGELTNLTPTLVGGAAIVSFSRDCSRLVTVLTEPLNPGDLHVSDVTGGPLRFRRRTEHNRALLDELRLTQPEEFTAGSDGGEVHGWLLVPPEAKPQEPVPLVLYVHGGPHTQYGWGMMHELQYLCRKGFAVLYTNPRGSRGYGLAHTQAIRGDWGGADYRDLMAAVDAAVTRPEIDETRLGVTGGSYGGFMTNWIIGKTDRFRAAVTQRSVVNLHSMGGTCDFNFSDTEYFGGNTWDSPERLWEQSPLRLAGNVKTPLLIIHSEGDLRCPIEQAEQLFAALKVQGKEVEFIRYPREANHGLSRSGPPDLRVDRLRRIAGWFERWLES